MHYASITTRLQGLGSDKWHVHLKAKDLRRQGQPVIMLTIGEPDIAVSDELMGILERSMRAGRTGYSNGRGEPSLLEALSQKYSRRSGRAVGAENFVCFPGTQTALYAVMTALVESGDDVLAGDPLYATYDGIIRATGANRVSVPLDPDNGFRLRAADLEKAITPNARVLLLNTPHNPTGAVLSREEISAIGAVCERYGLWIVSDEVYEDLIFNGVFASPFDDPRLAERTIAVSSISKSHAATGFRSGWCAGSAEFCARLLPLAESMLFGNQPFIADMTAYALSHPSTAAQQMREAFSRRAGMIIEHLSSVGSITCHRPQAGMFLLADVRNTGLSGDEFALRLLDEEQVALMPGEAFGEKINGFVRISLTVPDETIKDACARIRRFVAGLGA